MDTLTLGFMKSFNNIIFDTDYTIFVVGGGYPKVDALQLSNNNIAVNNDPNSSDNQKKM